jgi:hypothetical protein
MLLWAWAEENAESEGRSTAAVNPDEPDPIVPSRRRAQQLLPAACPASARAGYGSLGAHPRGL